MSRWNPDVCCIRCKRPILRDGQVCRWHGQVWPCRLPGDSSVLDVPVGGGTLKVTGGHDVPPVPILDDPYESEE